MQVKDDLPAGLLIELLQREALGLHRVLHPTRDFLHARHQGGGRGKP